MLMHELKEYVGYDKNSGYFFWKKTTSNRVSVGSKAGSLNNKGYLVIRFKGKAYYAHRVAFILESGEDPKYLVDHKDGDKLNNAWDNLRLCSKTENAQNMSSVKVGTSKYKGVYLCKKTKKWVSQIKGPEGKQYLGSYSTEEEAAEIYNSFAKEFFGVFARLNNVEDKKELAK